MIKRERGDFEEGVGVDDDGDSVSEVPNVKLRISRRLACLSFHLTLSLF